MSQFINPARPYTMNRASVAQAADVPPGPSFEALPLPADALVTSGTTPKTGTEKAGSAARAFRVDDIALAWLLAVPLAVTVRFLPYYLMDRAGRVRDPLHSLLFPGGPVGLAFGLTGLGFFLFMWLYPLRKRVPLLRGLGNVGTWLRIHVLAGLSLPLIVAVHAGWRFTGLIGLGYFAMTLVCMSGIVGRYLYSHIPRRRNGLELTRDEVSNERRALLTRIAAESGLNPTEVESALALAPIRGARTGPGRVLLQLVADDLARRRALRDVRRRWSHPRPGVPAPDATALKNIMQMARREMALQQQMRVLEATHRVFRWWHVAHLPVALTALLAVLVHVVVAVWIGGVRLP
ncbi:MAG: hypothetical protein HZB25_14400 [Candidatus Eisenbacteria bacterium]|nr:hypothetical protein [Candidatus Eisenbacteria bacterium]